MRWERGSAVILWIVAVGWTGSSVADSGKTIQLRNDTSSAIVKLQARQTGTKPWPLDVIKQIPLGVHKIRPIPLASATACKYDLFITFDDGRQIIQPGVNVCVPPPVSIKQTAD